jgi:hypothetical protein
MTEHDFDRTVQLWLEDGPALMSDRALQAALDEIHVTRQRRALWPARRVFEMNSTIRLAIGAAVVLVVAVIGINLVPIGSGVGGGPAPSPDPTPTPIPLPVGQTEVGLTQPGTYLAGAPFSVPATIAVPAGWLGNVGGPNAVFLDKARGAGSGGASIALSLGQKIYADPCTDRGFLDPQPGSTVDDLASALAHLPGFAVTAPTAVTLDGYSGMQLTLTAPDTFAGCALPSDGYRIWQLPLGAVFSFLTGERMTVWILDVNGQRLVISSSIFQATTPQEQAEAQAILNSIHIATSK